MKVKRTILSSEEIKLILKRLAFEILEKNAKNYKDIILVGIKSRGLPMARYISEILKIYENINLPVGILDIKFYNDDLTKINNEPKINSENLDFSVDGKTLILVDDVLYSGKTAKTAIDFLYSSGVPERIQLCVLIDRGHHKFPIYADFVGKFVDTSKDEIIKVSFFETDKEENVKIFTK